MDDDTSGAATLPLDRSARRALTGGADMWHTVAVPEAGLGALTMTDGPAGARGTRTSGTTSLSFPCASALAATWDRALVAEVGAAIGEEVVEKGAQLLLGPTLNLVRTPLAGRNFECFSEDPLLTAELGVAYVAGVQAMGVGACAKHLVANEQETDRLTVSAEVDERTLREVQLAPFEAVVRRAGVAALMAAYNRLGGTFCSEHHWLLTDVVRAQWGFDGLMVSDWFGTHSVDALAAGLDLEMPGPPQHLGAALGDPLPPGVEERDVERAAARVRCTLARLGVGTAPPPDERSVEDEGRRMVARRAAAASIVLLHDAAGMLPLALGDLRRVAVIGPNADRPATQGGGSAQVNPHRSTTPREALASRLGPDVRLVFEAGCRAAADTEVLDARLLDPGRVGPDGRVQGLALAFAAGGDPLGPARHEEVLSRPHVFWNGPPAEGLSVEDGWSARATAGFRPDRGGRWRLGLQTVGPVELLLDGVVVLADPEPTPGPSFFGFGSREVTVDVDLEAGVEHTLELRYRQPPGAPVAGISLRAAPPFDEGDVARAVAAAREADVAVVVVGTTTEWESEGIDRPVLDLPGPQAELIRAVCAAQPATVVVLNAGAPVTVDWAEAAGAVLQWWLPGQEGADALAGLLVGDTDPTGRLPVTFPVRVEDGAAHGSYPGEDGRVVYREGLRVGYRHHDHTGVAPAYCFGHGLAFTTFAYGPAAVVLGSGPTGVAVRVEVANTGARVGTEVVQVYARCPGRPGPTAPQELVGFATVRLASGERQVVEVGVDPRAWTWWSVVDDAWAVDPGPIELVVASSSRHARTTVALDPAVCPSRPR